MGTFVVTTASGVLADALVGRAAAGLREGVRHSDGPLLVATAERRAIEHVNALAPAPDRWIVGTGTCVTRSGRRGEDTLREILDRIDPVDPTAVHEHIFGHYVLVVRARDRAVAFCDAIAPRELYHWTSPSDPGAFVVSDLLSDFLHREGIPRSLDALAAAKAAFHGERGIARGSVLPGVRTVWGDEVIEIAPGSRTLRVRSVAGPRAPEPARGFIAT